MAAHDLILFFLQVSAMLAVALTCGQLMRKLHQPSVLGELMGGILLGPTVLGFLAPALHAWLFPPRADTAQTLEVVIRTGMLFFLFVAGLEINLNHLKERSRTILLTSLFGCMLPFALGLGSVFLLPDLWKPSSPDPLLPLALFVGTALSISALPVITRILMDLRLLQHELGFLVLSSATLSDLVGWALFAALLNSLGAEHPWSDFAAGLVGVLLVSVLIVAVGNALGGPFLRWVRRTLEWPSGFIGVIIILILVVAALAEALGMHAIFGAFLVGVALHRVFALEEEHPAREIIHQFAVSFFAPLYFVSVGLKADFTRQFDLELVLLVIALATLGKVGGAALGARLSRMPVRRALAVGFALNARGAMEIVLASVALEFHLIDERLFVALVTMALVTSLASGPALQWLMKPARAH